MECEWQHEDCKFLGTDKCSLCVVDSMYYVQQQTKPRQKGFARRQQKQDKRMGSSFEYQNHKKNNRLIKDDIVSSMTLNSGATVLEKGDEQIRGLVNIMEELKTKVVEQAPGKKTFTIQEKWLSKLRNEAAAEGMEFYYLKFSFHETDPQIYIIVEEEQIASMVKTMVTDRREKIKLEAEKKVLEKQKQLLEAEKVSLQAKIELLEALSHLEGVKDAESDS